jgi:hypothetical protein
MIPRCLEGPRLLWPERYRVAPTDAAPRIAGQVICQSGCRARDAQLTFTLSAPSPRQPGTLARSLCRDGRCFFRRAGTRTMQMAAPDY